jgi:AmmeMemoRadiSam system protein B
VHFFELVRRSGKIYDTIVILNPDHQGYSPNYATSPHDFWETPLGLLPIDKLMADLFPKSELAHTKEHSAEVMLPFIQQLLDQKAKILPISMGNPTPDSAKELAIKLYKSAQETNRKILVIASSDFSHYVTPQDGVMLDDLALDRIYALDSLGFFQVVRKHGISICGYGPIMTLIEYSLLCSKLPKVEIAARGNSGKHSPSKTVVDYITIIFSA